MNSPDEIEILTPILGELHLKWVTLNDKCKTLQSSLTEVTTRNEELEMKLTQSLERTTQAEEENKRLKMMVKKLQKKILSGSVHQLISALKQNIRVYDETVLPSISKLTKSVTGGDDDLDTSSSEDENDSCCLSVLENRKLPAFSKVDGSSRPIEICVNHVDVSQPVQNSLSKYIAVPPSQINSSKDCNSNTISSSVTTSSTIVEKHSGKPEILKTQSTGDQCISSTTLFNIPPTNEAATEPPTVRSLNLATEFSQNSAQSSYIDIADIESCVVEEEEQIPNSDTSSTVTPNIAASLIRTFLIPDSELPMVNERQGTQENFNNCQEKEWKPKITLYKPPNIEDVICSTIEVHPSESETNQSERLKRPCPSPSNSTESSPKDSAPKKSRKCTKNRKCLICEYEDIDGLNDNTFETHSDLDQHIIESHPSPTPCYVCCMFNDGKCTRHFHSKQNFHKHVKRVHSHEDLNSVFKTNQRMPLKCTTCGKLYLFKSDLTKHCARAHGSVPNEKKTLNVNPKKSKLTAECEVCKKENRLPVKYRLYDELDSHIIKYHSDPFPDYLRCPYCTRHFKVVNWLTQHIINKHPNAYSDSPLEKFLPSHCQAENEQEIMDDVDIESNNTVKPVSTEAYPLRILSPTSINKSVSNVIKSATFNI